MSQIRNYKNKSIVYYLEDVKKYNVLSKDEERELLIDYKLNNNIKSRNKLIECNQRLIFDYVIDKTNDENYILDLVQMGNFGLIKAIDNFDINYDNCLSTYAYFWIKLYVDNTINRDKYFISSQKYVEIKKKVNKYIYNYYNIYLKYPTYEEILNELKIDKKELDYALNIIQMISLEQIVDKEETEDFDNYSNSLYAYYLTSLSSDFDYFIDNKIITKDISNIINEVLDDKKIYIMNKKFGLDNDGFSCSDLELSKELDVSVKLINYHYRKAISDIRKTKKIKKYK